MVTSPHHGAYRQEKAHKPILCPLEALPAHGQMAARPRLGHPVKVITHMLLDFSTASLYYPKKHKGSRQEDAFPARPLRRASGTMRPNAVAERVCLPLDRALCLLQLRSGSARRALGGETTLFLMVNHTHCRHGRSLTKIKEKGTCCPGGVTQLAGPNGGELVTRTGNSLSCGFNPLTG